MAKYLLLKHYRGAPSAVNDVPMDQWTPEEISAHIQYMIDFAARLVRSTRPGSADEAPDFVRKWVRWGAGPRAGQALLLGAKAHALIDGRSVVSHDDIREVALPVLRHRILLNFQAEADQIEVDSVIRQLLALA